MEEMIKDSPLVETSGVSTIQNIEKHEQVYQSNSTVVTLNNIKKEMSGQYKCEVSADAPLFHTIIKSARLQVIEKPRTLPEIHVEKTKYSVGEKIRANCTSRSSFPAANLTFYANGVPLHNNDLSRLAWYVKSEGGGLESSLMELETIAVPGLFHDGRLRLRCVATQFHLYRQGADVWLQEDTPQLAHVLGSSSNHDFDSSSGRASLSWWWLLLPIVGHASR